MSPRCLVILDGKAFFSCRASIWREDVMAEVDGVKPFEGANILGRTPSPWPLRRYSQIVQAYTMRQLRYRSDIVNAFAGIAKAITSSMASTRMFYAMPAQAFDWAILWTGHLRLRNLKRHSGFPSWAWVGWEGEILMAGDTYSSFDQHWLLTRTWVEWYIVLEDGKTVLIWDPGRDKSIVSTLTISDTESDGGSSNKEEEDGGNDESDGEDDEDICPTYDNPSSNNNPYGRKLKPQLLSALPEQPDWKQRKPSDRSRFSPGTLLFSTVVARFTLESTSSSIPGGTFISKLRDSTHRMCGFIWKDLERVASEENLQEAREILLLSQVSPGTSYMFNRKDVGFADEYRQRITREEALEASSKEEEVDGEDILNEWHSWDFFNIMPVVRVNNKEESGDDKLCVYERGGIGVLHKNALAHALDPDPYWKMVYLK